MRTTIYARYSTDRQSESSIDDQLRVCRQYVATQGWVVAGVYTDEGISGAAMGNRPGVRDALSNLSRGDALIVTDLSRLSRSQDLAPLITRLRHRGVQVIGVQDGYDSESRTARMQAGLSGIMSEEFRAMVSDRTRSALELRARMGQATGGKAYENAEIVREVFERAADGETLKAIVSDLNRRGIPSPGAEWKQRASPRGKWLVSALHSLLQNERYIGRLVWGRSQWLKDPDTGKRRRIERPESEWTVRTCEPMVDQETWDLVQARFSHRQGKGGQPRYLLSGLLECADCGSRLIVMGGSQHRYICGAYHAGGAHACANSATFPRALAEREILAGIVEQMLSPAAISIGVRMMAEERKAAEAPRPVESQEVVALERMVREGILSPEVAAPALAEARKKAKPPVTTDLPWPSPKAWREAVEGMRDILRGDDVTAAREALRDLIGTLRVPASGEVIVAARSAMLATGTGRWIGSGGALVIHLPTSSRSRPA